MLALLIICLLCCSLSSSQVVSDGFYAQPVFVPQHVYMRPTNLITRESYATTSGMPLAYQFVTDYPHPHVPEGGSYIKPGTLVANIGVGSKPLYFKNKEQIDNVVLHKEKNILYLAFPVLQNLVATKRVE